ncbi:ABC transporter permease [Actinoplanes sp. SE50]|uniref:branched-chain amino acid ABC transporter permease n=1 Tax=unclassified Actinoplanes TaxID=2626549 RepID=UPI00023EC5E4|nr:MULTISPECIES: branched-chain amino acid ABC transporter permease [unclassified Actinoplanes]AEV83646.1 High-affinity branched-chain amino acid transport system permease protein livM [Actinoplanes sp. SE50/110]ATO82210.1 ABC transporter permease [Actinoplanes sp. SE50]SLL99617.1 ABC transporter permease [Actinoplanes sp. SE50/110]
MKRYVPLVLLLLAAALPYSAISLPGLFEGPLNSPGTLQLLAVCLVFGGLALGYDLLFGRAGLLSFGHALFIAAGAYGVDILIGHYGWSLWGAAAVTVAAAAVLAGLLGSVALRTSGIAFSMVTLAFAEVGHILVNRDPGGLTGGEEGLPMRTAGLPDRLVGVSNTVNLYWLALASLIVVVLVVHAIDRAPLGRTLTGLRDDERRIAVVGLDPYRVKLVAFVVAGALAGLGGVVYALVTAGASPHVASCDLTLTLIVMAVLGGAGTRWGALAGGILYAYLDQRLARLGGRLPGPLGEPLFVLGILFILAVYFVPGGLAGLRARLEPLRRAVRRREALPTP